MEHPKKVLGVTFISHDHRRKFCSQAKSLSIFQPRRSIHRYVPEALSRFVDDMTPALQSDVGLERGEASRDVPVEIARLLLQKS
jgi:hypothetical protein